MIQFRGKFDPGDEFRISHLLVRGVKTAKQISAFFLKLKKINVTLN